MNALSFLILFVLLFASAFAPPMTLFLILYIAVLIGHNKAQRRAARYR